MNFSSSWVIWYDSYHRLHVYWKSLIRVLIRTFFGKNDLLIQIIIHNILNSQFIRLLSNHILPIVCQDRWCNTMGHHGQVAGIYCLANDGNYARVGNCNSTVDICDSSEFRCRSHLNMIFYPEFLISKTINSLVFTIYWIAITFFPSFIWIGSVAPWGIMVNFST